VSGHTKGPWKISRGVDGPDNRVIETPDGWGVADAWGRASVGEMDANAHLIAAAPDLLEALEAIAPMLPRSLTAESWGDPAWTDAIRCVEYAIKKARGVL
jgi:hypothetical protein